MSCTLLCNRTVCSTTLIISLDYFFQLQYKQYMKYWHWSCDKRTEDSNWQLLSNISSSSGRKYQQIDTERHSSLSPRQNLLTVNFQEVSVNKMLGAFYLTSQNHSEHFILLTPYIIKTPGQLEKSHLLLDTSIFLFWLPCLRKDIWECKTL